jgi:histidine phosphotransferase ChpT
MRQAWHPTNTQGHTMNQRFQPTDLELAALISSKICHDVINPVGAINNGLEILDEDKNVDAQRYALEMIRNVTAQASARLQFARYAFGAAGSAGSMIDLGMAAQVSLGFVGQGKHKLVWPNAAGMMTKDRVKLLLNLISSGMTALPRGGEIVVAVTGTLDEPSFAVTCRGTSARSPQYLADFLGGTPPTIDSLSIQAYYTARLASTVGLTLTVEKVGADIVLRAVKPAK